MPEQLILAAFFTMLFFCSFQSISPAPIDTKAGPKPKKVEAGT
tara:strand:+ start:709 stop:837 length:129 start_codon:yes stop_codon:yes gene_type:complete